MFGQYIRPQRWTLWFTEIVVADGKDDVATCFFRGSVDGHLVLMLATQNDAWIVTAHEIPERSWPRVHSETMEEYVDKMVAEAREQGTRRGLAQRAAYRWALSAGALVGHVRISKRITRQCT